MFNMRLDNVSDKLIFARINSEVSGDTISIYLSLIIDSNPWYEVEEKVSQKINFLIDLGSQLEIDAYEL
jgi:hypothetical protein